ncbi:chemotaxis protein CheX [Quadrisphaera sp. KR29]|uniref:chemotaxis protein CheX n=1 Tax=Quadrisphaera sp. KR29 TaxID=3461391 RepID=UPI00404474B9
MSAPAELLPEETVRAVVDEIFASFVGEDEVLLPLEGELPEQTVSAWVGIEGPWRGRVVLTCAPATAEELTRALLRGQVGEQLEPEDVEDGFGELANVVGGGLKALLPDVSSLTLPRVGAQAPAGAEEHRVASLWRGEPFDVVITSVPPTA